MCTEIDKHCEIGHKRILMSSIVETENRLSYCGSTIELISNVAFALHGIEPPTLWSQAKHETTKLQNQRWKTL